ARERVVVLELHEVAQPVQPPQVRLRFGAGSERAREVAEDEARLHLPNIMRTHDHGRALALEHRLERALIKSINGAHAAQARDSELQADEAVGEGDRLHRAHLRGALLRLANHARERPARAAGYTDRALVGRLCVAGAPLASGPPAINNSHTSSMIA